MRVAVICVPAGTRSPLVGLADALAHAFEAAGHRAERLELETGASRLAAFDYIALGSEPLGLGGRLPPRLAELLGRAPALAGKRGMAFLLRRGLAPERALGRLMAAMEAEGMRVNYTETLAGAEEAAAAGRRAPVERN